MNDHYYTAEPASAHEEWHIELRILDQHVRFTTDAGVFSRGGLDKGTEALLNALPPLSGRLLDLGCGWGALGVTLGAKYPELEVVMTDINHRAADLARRNLAANGVRGTVLEGDGFEPVEGRFDAIVTNPPIRTGKAVIYALFDRARDFLAPGGSLFIVIRKQQGAASALRHLQEQYARAAVIDRSGGYWVIRADA